jgi:hypothetical protein
MVKFCREIVVVVCAVLFLSFFPADASTTNAENGRLRGQRKTLPVVANGEPVPSLPKIRGSPLGLASNDDPYHDTDAVNPYNGQQMGTSAKLREENLVKGGQVSQHYLDLNPGASDQGYDWDNATNEMGGDQFSYQHTPYGGKNSGPKRDGVGLHVEPLYYNPDDPQGGAFNTSARHYKWSYGKWRPVVQGGNLGLDTVAHLPRGTNQIPDGNHPKFGFIPANSPNANDLSDRPFHLGDSFRTHLTKSLIPTQVPFPISNSGNGQYGRVPTGRGVYAHVAHPVYAKTYYPGVQPGNSKFNAPTPLIENNRASRPSWNDAPNSWPNPAQHPSPEIRTVPIPAPPLTAQAAGATPRL